MATAVVDSCVLIAFASASDQRHEPARAVVDGIDEGALPTGRVTDYVVAETLNFLYSRNTELAATDLYDGLDRSAGFEVVQTPADDFRTALDLFGRYDGLSFVDATLVAYMRRAGVNYFYSFDDDFDAVTDLTRMDVAEDPFS